jgi:hypothetical protein
MKILIDFSGSLKKALSFCSAVGLPGAGTWTFLTPLIALAFLEEAGF